MAGLLSIGVSGLHASQAHLQTTGHNITNADTAGFSRQQAMQKTAGGQYIGPAGFIGSGTTLNDVRRIYSGFIDTQLQSATALNGDTKAYLDNISRLDSLLADSGTGVNVVLNGFFDAVQNVVSKPTDIASRQLLITSAESLSARFRSVQAQMEDQNAYLNSQLKSLSGSVNDLASKIAQLNDSIQYARATGAEPNDLLDTREQAVRELSDLVGVKVVDQDGQYALFLGNGQPLVIGGSANSITAQPSQDDPSRMALVFNTPTASLDVSGVLSGGAIGGLLRYRNDVLDTAMNELGRLSLVVSDQINQQLAQGLDLNGDFGATLFRNINDPALLGQRSIAQAGNTSAGNFEVTITDSSQLTVHDYEVRFDNPLNPNEFKVLRSDGKEILPELPATAWDVTSTPPPAFDGISLKFNGTPAAPVPPATADRFTLVPTRQAAGDIQSILTEPKRLGFTAPLNATTGTGNYGTGAVSQPELNTRIDIYEDSVAQDNMRQAIENAMPVKLVFDSAAQRYNLFDAQGTAIAISTPIVPGKAQELTFSLAAVNDANVDLTPKTVDFTITVSGTPAHNDSFSVGFNPNGQTDNRNALALQDLQSKATVGVNTTTGRGSNFSTAYGSLISEVGAKAAQAKADNGATEAILAQATATRESLSGVNLDEEAANLIKFQQYYTASSQIIKAAQETFNTLLSAL
ncbi:MAG TPA: flagellar hook-associated protein FlgK [Pseudomonas sp.]|uniref:flagellar hook-associated protein FlgK n=1 Tax=Pseudomonas sp. TaxID=306 RepID=UPI002BFB96C7|nr:flagellar hook-associated protein FlgK [Pseudomonas sp.]HTO18353.1 flagellar hook-associated protein FlgK [Pseudomonas sp.]